VPSPEVVDYLGKQEIIFCGPDENTAELMDWACLHGRARGYPFWKAFTTGACDDKGKGGGCAASCLCST